jgi:hypothetical protein
MALPEEDAMQPLIALVYRSTQSAPLTPTDLHVLLRKARIRNRQARITGALLYDGTQFMQCLEGPAPALETIYEAILRDARHRQVSVLFKEPVRSREFPDWSMAFVSLFESDRQAALRSLGLDRASADKPVSQLLAHFVKRPARQVDAAGEPVPT